MAEYKAGFSMPHVCAGEKNRAPYSGKTRVQTASCAKNTGRLRTKNSKNPIETKSRPKKPRRQIPRRNKYIPDGQKPSELDVVGGRGGVSIHHNGNRRYWSKVLGLRPSYRACGENNQEKIRIAQSIVDYIESSDGRFLEREKKTRRFFVLPKTVALEKVKQALRDVYVPLWAR
jgi:hypothetical protein